MNHSPERLTITCADMDKLYEPGRLLVSHVVQLNAENATRHNYQPGALVPAAPRQPDKDTLRTVVMPPGVATSLTIWLLPRSNELRTQLQQKLAEQHSQTTSQPAMITTTLDYDTSPPLHPGLHVDNHEQLPNNMRHNSHGRLGYNNGPGRRSLLVGTLGIMAMVGRLGGERVRPHYIPNTQDARDFYTENIIQGDESGGLQAIWLQLDPGDGYWVQTEQLVHDGSTMLGDEPSTIHFWLAPSLEAALDE